MVLVMGGLTGVIKRDYSDTIIKEMIEIMRRQEHLGKDGCGFVVFGANGEVYLERYPGELEIFVRNIKRVDFKGIIGIGQVRYATHGRPSIENTPPLSDCTNGYYVVMEGVIGDYNTIRRDIAGREHIFLSRNDTEIIAHVIEEECGGDIDTSCLMKAYRKLHGVFSILIIHKKSQDKIVVFSKESRIFIGKGEDGVYFANELEALESFVSDYLELYNGIGIISIDKFTILDAKGNVIEPRFKKMPEKFIHRIPGGFDFYMEREIYESSEAIKRAFLVHQDEYLDLIARMLQRADKTYIIGAGTSYHAALLGGYLLRELADIPAIVIDSTEFPYYALKDVTPGTVIIAISQSGKSTDVIRAVSKAKMYGASIIGITNRLGTPLMFASNLYLPIGVGLEHAVPATKSFLGQLLVLYKMAFKTAEAKGTYSKEALKVLWKELELLPLSIKDTIKKVEGEVEDIAKKIFKKKSMFVSSRGLNFPIALEGALKIKEVSYIHAEGIEAGMLRHGPKAIIEEGFPVITIMPYEKDARDDTYSLLNELKQLGAQPIIITDDTDKIAEKIAEDVIKVPKVDDLLTPFVNILPLQLLALKLGLLRGNNIDAPRGLTKFVILQKP